MRVSSAQHAPTIAVREKRGTISADTFSLRCWALNVEPEKCTAKGVKTLKGL
jgi:hypothetical protein